MSAVYDYVERVRPALLPRERLLGEELFVHSSSGTAGWVDLVEGEWIEGETLDVAIARAARAGDGARLGELSDAFDALCRELLAAEWAHGDLKPENIVVRASKPNGPATPLATLTLIDCDAMWIPALAGQRAAELGTPGWRHPGRTADRFDKRIDDYPALLISASLHALALRPALFARFNTPDTLLVSPSEAAAGTSVALDEMSRLFAAEGLEREYLMTEALTSPFPEKWHAAIL
jgi:hypothetical protein